MRTVAMIAAAAVVAGGCDSPLAAPGGVSPGILELRASREAPVEAAAHRSPERIVITAPDSVRAGVPFVVDVFTIGLDGCWTPAGERISVEPGVFTIAPYDQTTINAGHGCPTMEITLVHRVELRAEQRGEHRIRVLGRRVIGDPRHSSAAEVDVPLVVH